MITLRQLMEENNLSRTGVARLFNTSLQTIGHWPLDGPIPAKRERELRDELMPKKYGYK